MGMLQAEDPAPRPEYRGHSMSTSFARKFTTFFLLGLSAMLGFSATQARGDEGDPPSRVARISILEGSVSIQPGGTGDWGNAVRNRPVTVGDKLWSDKDSRVELRAGQASIHLGSDTALSFLNLDQNITQMRLSEGSINFRVRELREGDLYEVDTPNLAFTVREAGAFRIDVNENGDSTAVTVIRGDGEVAASGKTYPIHAGERGDFNGVEEVQSAIDRAPAPDGLDRWASERDLREDNAVSSRYVSRDMVGYDDLDDYGDWRDEPNYGHVWYPRHVEADWAPYSMGSWSWVGPWGWTWVDEEPWGFAPYHYGRWSYINGGWGWCPGPIYAAPVYGPAFVGFLGGGWSVGFGFGGGFGYGVGWFPLGFGEPFCPWYSHSNTYIRNVNISNTYIHNTNIINNGTINNYNYRYAHEPTAVTATTRNGFVNGQPVNRGEAHLTAASLRGAQVNTKFSVAPTHSSYLGAANTGKRVATPPAAIISRPVVARTTPAPAASHMPVHTVNASSLTPGRQGAANVGANGNVNANRPGTGSGNSHGSVNANSGQVGHASVTQSQAMPLSGRQRELALNRPPSAAPNAGRPQAATPGFNNGSSHSTSNVAPNRSAPPLSTNRPPWAGTNSTVSPRKSNTPNYNGGPSNNGRATVPNNNRSYAPPQRSAPSYNTPTYSNRPAAAPNVNRSYTPPQHSAPSYNNDRGYSVPRSSAPPRSYSAPSAPSRSYSAPSRSYSAPNRSYSAPPAPSRSYSAPSRSYSAPPAPSRSYSAPSRSYSAPSRSYSAPSAPSRSYSAPSAPRGGDANRGHH
jgi:hypothetical protein